jgi:hypothetical protein
MPTEIGKLIAPDTVLIEGGNVYYKIDKGKWRFCLKADSTQFEFTRDQLFLAFKQKAKVTLEGNTQVPTGDPKTTYILERYTIDC